MVERATPATPRDQAASFASGHDVDRLVFFSDAVFAIAITLLALEIHVPDLPRQTTDASLMHELRKVLPNLVSYVVSFAVIGGYWWWHHNAFRHVRRFDGPFVALNLVFLGFIALIPFPAGLYGHFFRVRAADLIYTGFLAATGLVGTLVWRYAATHDLLTSDLDPRVVRYVGLRVLGLPVAMACGFVAVLFDPQFLAIGILSGVLVIRLLRLRAEKMLRA